MFSQFSLNTILLIIVFEILKNNFPSSLRYLRNFPKQRGILLIFKFFNWYIWRLQYYWQSFTQVVALCCCVGMSTDNYWNLCLQVWTEKYWSVKHFVLSQLSFHVSVSPEYALNSLKCNNKYNNNKKIHLNNAERDIVPAFSIHLYCKSLPSTAPAQLPESSALLHSGAERVGYTHQIVQCQGCIYSEII